MSEPGEREVLAPREDDPARWVERRRQLRLRMLGVIAASYALDSAILLLYAMAGTTTFSVPLTFALSGALVCAAFLVVFAMRVGEQRPDPFLSLWQLPASAVVQLVFLAAAPEVGFVFLTVLFIIFGFGALRLTIRAATIGWGLTALGVIFVLPLLGRHPVIPTGTSPERWISCLCFIFTLGRCAAIGLLGSSYREVLGQRTRALHRLNASLEDLVENRTSELALAKKELERLVAEQSVEIKTLRGVLPICSHCKRIRDDKGSWTQLEAYISNHADVFFSHGLCAECRQKHFPGYPRAKA